jgi:hypothetical protein
MNRPPVGITAGSMSPSVGPGIAPGRPGKTPGMVKGMLSGTIKDTPSGMVKGTLPKSRGDAAGRVAVAGPRPAASPLVAPGCEASSTTLLSTSIGSPTPLGVYGEAPGANPLPRELPREYVG